MSGFFSKLFGGGSSGNSEKPGAEGGGLRADRSDSIGNRDPRALVEDTLYGVLERAGLELDAHITEEKTAEGMDIFVDLTGPDEESLTEKDGALLDALQLFMKRALQHQVPDERIEVIFDSNGFRDESTKSLVEMADRLKDEVLETGKSQYMRPLGAKDRKTVHQHLAGDERVRSRSIGNGLFKKIKIYAAKNASREEADDREEAAETI
jgi:spoIIIJ-associated protein